MFPADLKMDLYEGNMVTFKLPDKSEWLFKYTCISTVTIGFCK